MPILASTIIANGKCRLYPVVKISDVDVAVEILEKLGAKCIWKDGGIDVDTRSITSNSIDLNLSKKMRASVLFLGALLARFGKAKVFLPGGCKIGKRPIDFHLSAFESLGCKCSYKENGLIEVFFNKKKILKDKSSISLVGVSVGATENAIMASLFLNKEITINNAAREPEVIALCNALKKYGVKFKGVGKSSITLRASEISGGRLKIPADRIVAGTLACCFLASKGSGRIYNYPFEDLKSFTSLISLMGAKVEERKGYALISSPKKIQAVSFQTAPHPAFPTDLQPLITSVLCKAQGSSRVVETVFEKRFLHLRQLEKMGAKIKIKNQECIIEGVRKLHGAELKSSDLRCAAALIVAALSSQESSILIDRGYLERGYFDLIDQLRNNGANIK